MYYGLLVLLSLPFWVTGGLVKIELVPGLPVSALMALCPALTAFILISRRDGPNSLWPFLRQCLRLQARGHARLYAIAILLPPLAYMGAYGLMNSTGYVFPSFTIDPLYVAALLVIFLFAAFAEEIGWSAYILPLAQTRWNALVAALIVGCAWAVWHWVPLHQAGHNVSWIFWWSLTTIALRILIVWIYLNTNRSVPAASIAHAMSNISWQIFPVDGSHFDPMFLAPVLWLVAISIIVTHGVALKG